MAPRKTKGNREQSTVPSATTSVRVTRASSKRAAQNSFSVSELPEKKPKKAKRAGKGKPKEEPKEGRKEKTKAGDESKQTIVIEHCKQCNSFKTRANLVKEGLEKSVPGITVILNPEKPRRGCFEIREEGGEIFISLLDMKRPFTPMKQLDMDKVIADIIDQINNK
ncbi:uncharacterized protein LOC114757489 [Neltuma alba]|uniref:uncharacterized protein LOC114757489 n=1 Tax=Neltuma alba TaxID=207710 RepID=UPI0010A319BD|nr:uncharacterized protein LOC114757489 [Prosopis alba]